MPDESGFSIGKGQRGVVTHPAMRKGGQYQSGSTTHLFKRTSLTPSKKVVGALSSQTGVNLSKQDVKYVPGKHEYVLSRSGRKKASARARAQQEQALYQLGVSFGPGGDVSSLPRSGSRTKHQREQLAGLRGLGVSVDSNGNLKGPVAPGHGGVTQSQKNALISLGFQEDASGNLHAPTSPATNTVSKDQVPGLIGLGYGLNSNGKLTAPQSDQIPHRHYQQGLIGDIQRSLDKWGANTSKQLEPYARGSEILSRQESKRSNGVFGSSAAEGQAFDKGGVKFLANLPRAPANVFRKSRSVSRFAAPYIKLGPETPQQQRTRLNEQTKRTAEAYTAAPKIANQIATHAAKNPFETAAGLTVGFATAYAGGELVSGLASEGGSLGGDTGTMIADGGTVSDAKAASTRSFDRFKKGVGAAKSEVKRIHEDTRGQGSLLGGSEKSGKTITLDKSTIKDVMSTSDPSGEVTAVTGRDKSLGGGRNLERAGLNNQGTFVGSHTHQHDPWNGGTGKPHGQVDVSHLDWMPGPVNQGGEATSLGGSAGSPHIPIGAGAAAGASLDIVSGAAARQQAAEAPQATLTTGHAGVQEGLGYSALLNQSTPELFSSILGQSSIANFGVKPGSTTDRSRPYSIVDVTTGTETKPKSNSRTGVGSTERTGVDTGSRTGLLPDVAVGARSAEKQKTATRSNVDVRDRFAVDVMTDFSLKEDASQEKPVPVIPVTETWRRRETPSRSSGENSRKWGRSKPWKAGESSTSKQYAPSWLAEFFAAEAGLGGKARGAPKQAVLENLVASGANPANLPVAAELSGSKSEKQAYRDAESFFSFEGLGGGSGSGSSGKKESGSLTDVSLPGGFL